MKTDQTAAGENNRKRGCVIIHARRWAGLRYSCQSSRIHLLIGRFVGGEKQAALRSETRSCFRGVNRLKVNTRFLSVVVVAMATLFYTELGYLIM